MTRRFLLQIEETVFHNVEVELEDADGDAAAGYVTDELLDAAAGAMVAAGLEHVEFDADEISAIAPLGDDN